MYDERTYRITVIPANTSPLEEYCLREGLACDVRAINAATNKVKSGGSLQRSKRKCSVYNADWVLVRKRAGNAYTITRVTSSSAASIRTSWPMRPYWRSDIGVFLRCSLQQQSLWDAQFSRSDSFVNGRYLCKDGWITNYNKHGGVRPYCREAIFAEWSSAFSAPSASKTISTCTPTRSTLPFVARLNCRAAIVVARFGCKICAANVN